MSLLVVANLTEGTVGLCSNHVLPCIVILVITCMWTLNNGSKLQLAIHHSFCVLSKGQFNCSVSANNREEFSLVLVTNIIVSRKQQSAGIL